MSSVVMELLYAIYVTPAGRVKAGNGFADQCHSCYVRLGVQ
jgi:hypothetical protein